jgi:hypothetical protein
VDIQLRKVERLGFKGDSCVASFCPQVRFRHPHDAGRVPL